MDIITAQIITMVALFVTMITACFLPFFLVRTFGNRKKARVSTAQFEGSRYELGISFANCFSGGVFIATFFIGLLPHVREEFQELLIASGTKTEFPVTEFVVFMGFFLTLVIEHLTLIYQERKKGRSVQPRVNSGQAACSSDGNGSVTVEVREMSSLATAPIKYSSSDSEKEDRCHNHREDVVMPNFHGHTHEPGHSHDHHGHSHDISGMLANNPKQDSGIRFYILVLSLSVHSIFEGMALGLQNHIPDLMNLFVGVIIHEVLVAFSMGVSLARIKPSLGILLRFSILFSIMIPIGQALGLIVGNQESFAAAVTGAILQGIAAGTFIHVTFLEVIPSELYHRRYILLKIFFIFLGFLLIVISIFALGHHHSTSSFHFNSVNDSDVDSHHHSH